MASWVSPCHWQPVSHASSGIGPCSAPSDRFMCCRFPAKCASLQCCKMPDEMLCAGLLWVLDLPPPLLFLGGCFWPVMQKAQACWARPVPRLGLNAPHVAPSLRLVQGATISCFAQVLLRLPLWLVSLPSPGNSPTGTQTFTRVLIWCVCFTWLPHSKGALIPPLLCCNPKGLSWVSVFVQVAGDWSLGAGILSSSLLWPLCGLWDNLCHVLASGWGRWGISSWLALLTVPHS